jgi:Fe-S cluster assembly ATP-binding protein
LTVKLKDKTILNNFNLEINEGETHIIFGPNGCGKTTLLSTIMKLNGYKIHNGKIIFRDIDITNKTISEIANLGVGLYYQNPPKIKGVTIKNLIENIDELKLENHYQREINLGFSGGEKKRSELFQILFQNPLLTLFDEPESGVDIENIYLISKKIKEFLAQKDERGYKKSAIIITHSGYIMDYLKVDKAHVLLDGKIVCTGDAKKIFSRIKHSGYKECKNCERNEF